MATMSNGQPNGVTAADVKAMGDSTKQDMLQEARANNSFAMSFDPNATPQEKADKAMRVCLV